MHRFRIDMLADPQSLPRVAGFFAQRSIVPSGLSAQLDRTWMRVEVAVAGLAPQQAAVIAAQLGEAVAAAAVAREGTAAIAARSGVTRKGARYDEARVGTAGVRRG